MYAYSGMCVAIYYIIVANGCMHALMAHMQAMDACGQSIYYLKLIKS